MVQKSWLKKLRCTEQGSNQRPQDHQHTSLPTELLIFLLLFIHSHINIIILTVLRIQQRIYYQIYTLYITPYIQQYTYYLTFPAHRLVLDPGTKVRGLFWGTDVPVFLSSRSYKNNKSPPIITTNKVFSCLLFIQT